MSSIGASDTSRTPDHRDPSPRLRREATVIGRDRSRLVALVAACTLTGVAVGFSMSAFVAVHAARTPHVRTVAPAQAQVPWLGVSVRDGAYRARGAVVGDVFTGSPADRAGLRDGDRITSIAGDTIRGAQDVVEVVRGEAPGREVVVEVVRGDDKRAMSATLSSVPARPVRARYHHRSRSWRTPRD